jgi:hypothetical protein
MMLRPRAGRHRVRAGALLVLLPGPKTASCGVYAPSAPVHNPPTKGVSEDTAKGV